MPRKPNEIGICLGATEEITTAIIGVCDHLMTVVRSMMQQLHPLILTE
ncbi:MAG: hypothetical protein K9L22_00890 [Methylococcaceae bacterium]|nr:hypothetical protein [Methylococcaceae bacterium]